MGNNLTQLGFVNNYDKNRYLEIFSKTAVYGEILKIIHFYHFDSDPRFPPFLLYVRWKSEVTFVRRCFRDVAGRPQSVQTLSLLTGMTLLTTLPLSTLSVSRYSRRIACSFNKSE